MVLISVEVNASRHEHEVEPRLLLVQYLRETLGLTGTNIGCDTTSCGACTVLLNGESVKSCTILAVAAQGTSVTTLEGLAGDGGLHPVQAAFRAEHGLQCGFCTPGMVMAAVGLLSIRSHVPAAFGSIARRAPHRLWLVRRCVGIPLQPVCSSSFSRRP